MIFVNSYTSFPVGAPVSVEYPPIAPGAITPTGDSISYTGTITGQAYGNGTYEILTSAFNAGWRSWLVFDKIITGGAYATGPVYNGTPSGNYNGSFNTGGYTGDWLQIKLPSSIVLTSYSIQPPDSTVWADIGVVPSTFKMYGSTNGSTFTEIDSQSGITWTNRDARLFTLGATPTSFNHFRIATNRTGGNVYCMIGEVKLFGY